MVRSDSSTQFFFLTWVKHMQQFCYMAWPNMTHFFMTLYTGSWSDPWPEIVLDSLTRPNLTLKSLTVTPGGFPGTLKLIFSRLDGWEASVVRYPTFLFDLGQLGAMILLHGLTWPVPLLYDFIWPLNRDTFSMMLLWYKGFTKFFPRFCDNKITNAICC